MKLPLAGMTAIYGLLLGAGVFTLLASIVAALFWTRFALVG